MTHRPDPPLRAQRSLPLAILFGMAGSAIGMTFLHGLALLVLRPIPFPPAQLWVEYAAVRAAAGACVGAGLYAAGRLPRGWLRTCLYWALLFLLVQGEIPHFVHRSLHLFLLIWAASSLLQGVLVGTVFHLLRRRDRPRPAP